MGLAFFEHVLTLKEAKTAYLDSHKSLGKWAGKQEEPSPWLESFYSPPFMGDIVNQEIYPAAESAMIPEGFPIALPTKAIAEVWVRPGE